MGPLYFFLYYTLTPTSKLLLPGNRTTNTVYTRAILLTVPLFFYTPHLLSYLHPSLSSRHYWNWAWQLFPIFISLTNLSIAYLLPSSPPTTATSGKSSAQAKSQNIDNTDITTIRSTILTFSVLSAAVWIYTLSTSPFSLTTLFLPAVRVENSFLPVMRRFLQVDHVSASGSALMWLGYLFADMKREGV